MNKKFDITDTYTKRMIDAGSKTVQFLLAAFVSPLAVGFAQSPQLVDSHRFKLQDQRGEKPEYTTKVKLADWMDNYERRAKRYQG